jgi:adenylylsulfate reductase subunit A
MVDFQTKQVDTDILIIGGGMAGCGAAVEVSYWAKKNNLKVTLVEKAAIERSGAVAMGLSAINTYLGVDKGENTPEDFVRYVRNDQMGTVREDLVYDIGRHVDSSVKLFEKWGLPIWKDENGNYVREGRWQVMINGESYKPIVSEAAKTALGMDNIYERVFIVELLLDDKIPNKIAGAVGFSVRENAFYVFKAKTVIITTGGAVHIFKPRSTGEGYGRAWYPPWNSGSNYAMMLQAGAEMTQMESRFIPTRFKDGYGPVGAWFLLFKSGATNAFGENYLVTQAEEIKKWEPYASARPVPTPLRNHQMIKELMEGRGPVFMRTEEAIKKLVEEFPGTDKEKQKHLKKLESEAWEDFLDMTVTQAFLWAANNIEPDKKSSEIMASEPYFIGSHASCAGAWVSGPADIAPSEYNWGYNRMTTVSGLFTAGDGVGASAHKFSSGSFTEGRIAGKSAVKYVKDNPDSVSVEDQKIEQLKEKVFKPLKTFEESKGFSTRDEINPNYIKPNMFLRRLNKIMDEYVGGTSTWYTTNKPSLEKGLEYLTMLKEDSEKLGAQDLHELLRAWENYHRLWTAEAHLRHVLFREETRYPGYLYRSDFTKIDEVNWKVFVNSKWNRETNSWEMYKRPVIQIVP